MLEHTTIYFDACQYAYERLGSRASANFARLQQLAKFNSLDELKAIIDGWAGGPPAQQSKPAPNLWTPGSAWGDSVRVERDRGIVWRLKCSCGRFFSRSTNDTVATNHRKCDTCILADELSEERQKVVAHLESTSRRVLEWHQAHNKLIWQRIYKALNRRGISYTFADEFVRELNAMVWAKITSVADQYLDEGFKVTAWLGRVADNALADHFKVAANRERLAPTYPLPEHAEKTIAAPPTGPEELPPAEPVRPEGARPDNIDTRLSAWDRAQKWNG